MRERTRAALSDPDFIEDLCEDIADGKTLSEVVRERNIKYKLVFEWIAGDEVRVAAYEKAIQARGQGYRDSVLEQLKAATQADFLDAVNEDGSIKSPSEIPPSLRPVVVGYEESTTADGRVTRRIKAADKLRAAELLGRTGAMFTDKVDLGGKLTLEQLVMASMKEAEPEPASGG